MSSMGMSVNCRKIDGIDTVRSKVGAAYDIDCKVVSVELTYYVLAEKYRNGSQPTEIVSIRDYRSFLSLHKADKSLNLFVTFREMVGDELAIMRPKASLRAGLSLEELSNGVEDDVDQTTSTNGLKGVRGLSSILEEGEDENFLRAVDVMEAKASEAKASEAKIRLEQMRVDGRRSMRMASGLMTCQMLRRVTTTTRMVTMIGTGGRTM